MTALTIDTLVNSLLSIFDYEQINDPYILNDEPSPIRLASPTSDESYDDDGSSCNNIKRKKGRTLKSLSFSSHYDDTASCMTEDDDHSSDYSLYSGRDSIRSSRSLVDLEFVKRKLKKQGSFTSNVVNIEVPFGKPIEEVYDGVHDGYMLGSGVTGTVRKVTHKATGIQYAVKCLDLNLLETEESLEQLRQEIFIMCELDHPNIVRLEEVYESENEIYLVQELCHGGELFDRLDEQPDYHYTEQQCARLVKQMLCAVRYIHTKGIIHRDLKLENFIFSSYDTNAELKLIDFGLSKHFQFGEIQHEAVGSPYTVAPEVIRGCYDERCDIWAIGVIAFLLLSGDPPFGGCGRESLLEVRDNILLGTFYFEPVEIWEHVSDEAKNFISSLLVMNPRERPSARKAQSAPWLKKWARCSGSKLLNPNVVNALLCFKEYSDIRKLLCEVLSFTLVPEQIKELRQEFEKIDLDDSGEINFRTLKKVLQQSDDGYYKDDDGKSDNSNCISEKLSEEEIVDIFNAMRVKKNQTTIHWHEFIAAGLSQCNVDDRNLRLAFCRLDRTHKGHINFDDILDIMGSDCFGREAEFRRKFHDGLKDVCSKKTSSITYEEFVLLMKGQSREPLSDKFMNKQRKEKFHLSLDNLSE